MMQIRQTIIFHLTAEELEIVMFWRNLDFTPTKKGILLLQKIKKEFPFGKCEVISQQGEPHRVIRILPDDLLKIPQENLSA